MFAKINHVAIVSENYAILGKFYEAIFGMINAPYGRSARAVTVGDGYVGLNINPRFTGRPAGLDHFGIQVDDVEAVFDRMRTKYPGAKWLKRPSTRPFAGISAHDIDGNIFDISQKDMANRRAIYVEQSEQLNPRHIKHVGLRTLHPAEVAEFYREVFELVPTNKGAGDSNYYLSDGHITLVIMPWDIADYDGTGIIAPGMDHIGFKVESLDALKEDLDVLIAFNRYIAPSPLGKGAESAALEKLFYRSCPMGQYKMADPDGILLNVLVD